MSQQTNRSSIFQSWQFFIVLVLALAGGTSATAQTTFYVSPDGNDEWSGTSSLPSGGGLGPFATIERAQQEVRALADRVDTSITVSLRGGTYELDAPIRMTAADSGTSTAPVVYRNYPGEKVVISGGQRITGWQYYGDGLWFVDLPEVAAGEWYFDQLFVSGERRQRAKSPNQGHYRIENLIDGTALRPGIDRFGYREGDIDPNWTNLTDVKVVAFHHWLDVHLPIRDVDAPNRIVNFQMKTSLNLVDGNKEGARYFVENVFEGLDLPGEWYLNRQTGRLFYMPLQGEDPSALTIAAPRLTELMLIDGTPEAPVQYVTFDGLTFEHNQWQPTEWPDGTGDLSPAAITMYGGRNVRIENCVFRNLGTYAIDIWGASHENIIASNLMENLGGGGVKVGGHAPGQDSAWRTTNNVIADNTLRHLGQIYTNSRGIFLMQTAGNRVANNEISYLGYHGIQSGYAWSYDETASHDNVIESNHIHHVGHVEDQIGDLGGIYLNSVMPGTVVRGNLIHDITGTHLAFGIYLDGYSSDLLIENNVVTRTGDAGFMHHFGRNNGIRNNVFAFGEKRQVYVGKAKNSENFRFERNIVLWEGAPLLSGDVAGDHVSFDRNAYYRTDESPILFGEESIDLWRERGHDIESVIGDPQVSLDGKNFTIASSSPAIAVGFEPIDISGVGPRPANETFAPVFSAGDVNGDSQVNTSDIFYLINHLFGDGAAPIGDGDANLDGTVSVADVFYLINVNFGNTSSSAYTTTASLTSSGNDAIVLGDPVVTGNEMVVPVHLDLDQQTSVSSISFGIRVPEGSRVESISIERSGTALSAPVQFEATPTHGNEAGLIVSFDQPVTIADGSEIALIRVRLDGSQLDQPTPVVTTDSRLTTVGVDSEPRSIPTNRRARATSAPSTR